jgi:hypothetical protein
MKFAKQHPVIALVVFLVFNVCLVLLFAPPTTKLAPRPIAYTNGVPVYAQVPWVTVFAPSKPSLK